MSDIGRRAQCIDLVHTIQDQLKPYQRGSLQIAQQMQELRVQLDHLKDPTKAVGDEALDRLITRLDKKSDEIRQASEYADNVISERTTTLNDKGEVGVRYMGSLPSAVAEAMLRDFQEKAPEGKAGVAILPRLASEQNDAPDQAFYKLEFGGVDSAAVQDLAAGDSSAIRDLHEAQDTPDLSPNLWSKVQDDEDELDTMKANKDAQDKMQKELDQEESFSPSGPHMGMSH
jgi:hypothetical protein